MRCRRATLPPTAAAAAAAAAEEEEEEEAAAEAGAATAEDGGNSCVASTASTNKAKAKLVARRGNGFAATATRSGAKGAASSLLLAFLAAVSFRGMPRTPLLASGVFIPENSTLIAMTNRAIVTADTMLMDATAGDGGGDVEADGDGGNQVSTEREQLDAEDIWSERPDTATLTKGFSIPTYLPPFPDFIPADLPQTVATMGSQIPLSHPNDNDNDNDTVRLQSASNKPQPQEQEQQRQPQPRLHAYDSEKKEQELRREKQLARERQMLPRRQLSLPSRNVTVQLGQHAYLPCQLHQHSSKPLSWVRLRDEHIIAVDHTTFINDARFSALLQSPANSTGNANATSNLSWTLLIKYVQLQDKGWYECQLATEPKMSAKVQLLVITPRTELIGDKQRFVKAGSRVDLHCIVRGTLEPPKYIVWYRGDQQVMAENEAHGVEQEWYTQIDRNVFGNAENTRNTMGTLVIPVVRKAHSGNYTCEPANSQAVSLQLHVLSGEYSASAIKSTAAAGLYRHSQGYNRLHLWLLFLLVALNKT